MPNRRIVAEKYLLDTGIRVTEKTLNYQYPNLKPKMEYTNLQDMICIGGRGQLAIEMLEGDEPRNSMKMKIEEIKNDAVLEKEGIYQKPLSWNEFRMWVLAHPEVMDDWFDMQYGPLARYQNTNDEICWEGGLE